MDRIRIYYVLMAGLRLLRDVPFKNCRALAYAHGGHLLAVASSFSVLVLTSITAQEVGYGVLLVYRVYHAYVLCSLFVLRGSSTTYLSDDSKETFIDQNADTPKRARIFEPRTLTPTLF